MRNAFIDELILQAQRNDKIVLLVGDLGFNVVEAFAERFPNRFYNAGVSEQNMTGLAAGLAAEGYHVFTYSIANFPTFRCAEQVRNDVAYHRFPVTIVAVGGGLAYGALGYSHHAVQDYGLLRSMPNMLIASPGDPLEVRACVRYLVENPQPSYLRLGKTGEKELHAAVPEVVPGHWLAVRDGASRDAGCVLATGAALQNAADVYGSGERALFSLPLWGMDFKSLQPAQVRPWTSLITFEDHLADAGFGSWMLEALSLHDPELLQRLRIKALDPKVCGMVGAQAVLNERGGLIA